MIYPFVASAFTFAFIAIGFAFVETALRSSFDLVAFASSPYFDPCFVAFLVHPCHLELASFLALAFIKLDPHLITHFPFKLIQPTKHPPFIDFPQPGLVVVLEILRLTIVLKLVALLQVVEQFLTELNQQLLQLYVQNLPFVLVVIQLLLVIQRLVVLVVVHRPLVFDLN